MWRVLALAAWASAQNGTTTTTTSTWRLRGRLFIAVTVFREEALIDLWERTVLRDSVALKRGVADLRFFTDNLEFGTRRGDVVYIDEASLREERLSRVEAPWFWRDYLATIFSWAARHSAFEYLVRAEPDSLLCVDTIYRALPPPPSLGWAVGFQRKCGFDDTFFLLSRNVVEAVVKDWPELRKVALLEAGGSLVDAGADHGWPMLGPVLPRLLTWLRRKKGLRVHVVSSQWPRPSAEEAKAPWYGAVSHHPSASAFDGPKHEWIEFLDPTNPHYRGATDARDGICHGHFYIHKIKADKGIENGWTLVLRAIQNDKDDHKAYGDPLPSDDDPVKMRDRDVYPDFWPDLWNASLRHELDCVTHGDYSDADLDVPGVPDGPHLLLGDDDDEEENKERRRLRGQQEATANLRRLFQDSFF